MFKTEPDEDRQARDYSAELMSRYPFELPLIVFAVAKGCDHEEAGRLAKAFMKPLWEKRADLEPAELLSQFAHEALGYP